MTGALFASSMNLLNAIFLEEWNRCDEFGDKALVNCADSKFEILTHVGSSDPCSLPEPPDPWDSPDP